MKAPFTQEQINNFELYQKARVFHPYTCGKCNDRDGLKIKESGLYCDSCDYTQDWAYAITPELVKMMEKHMKSFGIR